MSEETATATETEAPAAPVAATTRHSLPDGKVTPIQFLNHLKKLGLAAKDHPPQKIYGYVKAPGRDDPFPVKHYDAEGNEFDTDQINEHGVKLTRPGLDLEEAVAWWGRADERRKAKAEKKAAAAKAKAEKAAKAAGTPGEVTAAEEEGESGDEETVESEAE